ncbi:hypothetical protein GDO81_015162 [Engystomops pustulosus]|uniref:Uncharacterized protein n=1 Tax=Engystomops pustulosus TaxID=76066 RepID=A0AAV7AQ14_ENGPU|nr:hypothetical protein GDO81_015162 [Engystomops pustulosus]
MAACNLYMIDWLYVRENLNFMVVTGQRVTSLVYYSITHHQDRLRTYPIYKMPLLTISPAKMPPRGHMDVASSPVPSLYSQGPPQ